MRGDESNSFCRCKHYCADIVQGLMLGCLEDKNSFFFVGSFVAQKVCSKKIVLFGGMGWERISGIFADSAGFFGGIDLIVMA